MLFILVIDPCIKNTYRWVNIHFTRNESKKEDKIVQGKPLYSNTVKYDKLRLNYVQGVQKRSTY